MRESGDVILDYFGCHFFGCTECEIVALLWIYVRSASQIQVGNMRTFQVREEDAEVFLRQARFKDYEN